MKSVRIVQYLASDAVRWHEDKYAQQQQQQIFSDEYRLYFNFDSIFFLLFCHRSREIISAFYD